MFPASSRKTRTPTGRVPIVPRNDAYLVGLYYATKRSNHGTREHHVVDHPPAQCQANENGAPGWDIDIVQVGTPVAQRIEDLTRVRIYISVCRGGAGRAQGATELLRTSFQTRIEPTVPESRDTPGDRQPGCVS